MKTNILIFGTFDYLHPGHIDFFKQARKLSPNPYLIVSIARDNNVKRIKGKKAENTEFDRLDLVSKCTLVDKAVLGDTQGFMNHILELRPSVIALGYDQKAYVQELKEELAKISSKIKVVRLKPYRKKIHKTHIKKGV